MGKLSSLGLLRGPQGPTGPTGPGATGPTGPTGAGGGSTGFSCVSVSSGNKTFNGDGSSGATQIYPMTILFSGQDAKNVEYDFDAVAVEEGWVVLFDIEGSSDASIIIKNQGSTILKLSPGLNSVAVKGIYFDGDDWRPIAHEQQGPKNDGATMWWHPVDILPLGPISTTVPQHATGGGFSTGCQFTITPGPADNDRVVQIIGVRFFWAGSNSKTIRCRLWNFDTSTGLESVDIAVTAPGIYNAYFASAYTVPSNRYYGRFTVSVWETTGDEYTFVSGSKTEISALVPARPFIGGARIVWQRFNAFKSGNAMPDLDGGNEWYIVEPILHETFYG